MPATPKPPAKAIIFDFDGVLAHSEPTHLLAVRETLAPLGLEVPDAMYYQRYVHLPDRELLRQATRDLGKPHEGAALEALLASKHAAFERITATPGGSVRIFPGAAELVRACAQAGPVGLCTAAQRRTIDIVLGRAGLVQHFRVVTTADDVERSKPDPLPYRQTCERLGFPPAACVAIEDTPGGVMSASGAGCRVVAVLHTVARERLQQANHIVERIADLSVDVLRSV